MPQGMRRVRGRWPVLPLRSRPAAGPFLHVADPASLQARAPPRETSSLRGGRPGRRPRGRRPACPCARAASACGLTTRPRPGSRNAGRSKGRTPRHPRPAGVHCRAAAATAAHLRAPQQPRRCAQAMPHDPVAASGRRPPSGGSVAPPKSVIRNAGRRRACKAAAPRQAGRPAWT